MKKLIAAVVFVLVLTGCNYREALTGQGGVDNPAAYTAP